jgi:hypothetical protein
MVISADFEKQKQYFDQENIASSILLYLFIAILIVKIARLTRDLRFLLNAMPNLMFYYEIKNC